MTEEEALDLVVQMAEKADNCLHTAKLPLPASIHVEGLIGALQEIRDGLNRALLALRDLDDAHQRRAAPVAEECCGGGDLCYPDCDKLAAAQPSPAQESAPDEVAFAAADLANAPALLRLTKKMLDSDRDSPDHNRLRAIVSNLRDCVAAIHSVSHVPVDVTAVVDARVGELARAAEKAAKHTGSEWPMRALAEAAEAGRER